MAFLSVLLQYVVELLILAAIGGLGAFIGIRLRKKKDAKLAMETGSADAPNDSDK